jgi:hypothetical protein
LYKNLGINSGKFLSNFVKYLKNLVYLNLTNNQPKGNIMTDIQNNASGSKVLAGIIEQSNGRFVSVSFVKKDGSIRNLVGRLGVTSHLKGGKKTVPEDKYITIFDTQKGAYRSINRDTILSVRSAGVEAVAV